TRSQCRTVRAVFCQADKSLSRYFKFIDPLLNYFEITGSCIQKEEIRNTFIPEVESVNRSPINHYHSLRIIFIFEKRMMITITYAFHIVRICKEKCTFRKRLIVQSGGTLGGVGNKGSVSQR